MFGRPSWVPRLPPGMGRQAVQCCHLVAGRRRGAPPLPIAPREAASAVCRQLRSPWSGAPLEPCGVVQCSVNGRLGKVECRDRSGVRGAEGLLCILRAGAGMAGARFHQGCRSGWEWRCSHKSTGLSTSCLSKVGVWRVSLAHEW